MCSRLFTNLQIQRYDLHGRVKPVGDCALKDTKPSKRQSQYNIPTSGTALHIGRNSDEAPIHTAGDRSRGSTLNHFVISPLCKLFRRKLDPQTAPRAMLATVDTGSPGCPGDTRNTWHPEAQRPRSTCTPEIVRPRYSSGEMNACRTKRTI